jgi:hypothetical protein
MAMSLDVNPDEPRASFKATTSLSNSFAGEVTVREFWSMMYNDELRFERRDLG